MNKIISFGVSRLRMQEDFGFHKLVIIETESLGQSSDGGDGYPEIQSVLNSVPDAIDAKIAAYKNAYNDFDAVLKSPTSNSKTSLVTSADNARDKSWRASHNYISAMCSHPDASIAEKAAQIKSIYDKYGDPTKLPQIEQSGILHNLLQDIDALDSDVRTSTYFDAWKDDLTEKENAYLAAFAEKTEEDSTRQVGASAEKRKLADTAYLDMVEAVNSYISINGNEGLETFVDHVNAIIDRQKTILKARTTRGKKETEEPDDKPVVQ